MKKALIKEGKILNDLHAHPANYKSDEETLEMLCSPGLVGLALTKGDVISDWVLTYEQVLSRFSGLVEEIDKGMLAKVKHPYENSYGYALRAQEIHEGTHHILAVCFEGEYLEDYSGIDARKVIEEIHKRNGLAILNHPYAIRNKESKIPFRFPTPKEEREINELCEMVDEVEVYNAYFETFNKYILQPTFGMIMPSMKKASEKTELLVKNHENLKGVVNTDVDLDLNRAKVCGIYVKEEGFCIEKLKQHIRQGNFDNDHRKPIGLSNFVTGLAKMFYNTCKNKK